MLNPRPIEGSDRINAGFNKVKIFPFLEKQNKMN